MNENELKLLSAEQYEETGQFLFAVQIYMQLLQSGFEERRITLRLAHLYEQMKLYDNVEELIENYLSEHDKDEDLLKLYAQFLLRVKKFEKVVDLLSGKEVEKKTSEFNYYLGLASYERGNITDAKNYFAEYIKLVSSGKFRNPALLAASEISIALKEYETALEYLEELEKSVNDELGRVYYLFAKVYFAKGMNYYAQDFILRSLKRNYIAGDSYLLAGKIHFEIEEFEKAEEFFSNSLKDNKKTPEVFSFLGFISLNKNNVQKAQEFMTMALEIDPYDEYVLALKRTLLNE